MTLATYFCPDRKTSPERRPVRDPARTLIRKALSRIGLSPSRPPQPGRPLTASQARLRAFRTHLLLWTLQAWLAMFFLGAAYAKLTEPMDLLIPLLGWPASMPTGGVRILGAVELGLGLTMMAPLASWRLGGPITVAGALLLVVLSLVMALVHVIRLEIGFAILNVVLATMAIIVAGGRGRSPSARALAARDRA